jgi:hypothetical protein
VKTYPIRRDDGVLHAFEITSAWFTFRPVYKLLRSVDGVSGIRRNFFSDNRISFLYRCVPFVVHEPFGDNSRYWVGPEDPKSCSLDLGPLHEAFLGYRRPILRVLDLIRRTGNV